jgi:hypothetical protein
MYMKGLIAGIVILVLLGLGNFLINWQKQPTSTVPNAPLGVLTYESPAAGITFTYPSTYRVEARSDGFDGQTIAVMTLINKDVVIPDYSEGPPAISIIAVPNPSNMPLDQWVRSKSISNFALSIDQKLSATTVEGEPALAYTHSGLYESDAVAFVHNGKVYLLSVGWADAQDAIRSDFQNLLKTITFK